MTGWALSQEVYSIAGLIDDIAWSSTPLSPRVTTRAQADDPGPPSALYIELVQQPPASGPAYDLIQLSDVNESDEYLSDRVDKSFEALRQRLIDEAGWDYLSVLSSSWLSMTHTPPTGHSRMSYHVCGRAIGLDQEPYEEFRPRVELVREDVGNLTYWRIYVRASEQDGSMGEPLREAVWDLDAREEEGRPAIEGGKLRERIPSGYYVDFTALAADYGWERVPSMWRWRYFWPDIRWWEFQKTDGLTWWECMLEVFEPEQIEEQFGPLPGYESE